MHSLLMRALLALLVEQLFLVTSAVSAQVPESADAFSCCSGLNVSLSARKTTSFDFANEVPIESGTESSSLPAAPEPMGAGGGYDHYQVVPAATWHQIPFSRMAVGADISPLGVGIKSAIVLNHYFDARLMGNVFSLDVGKFDIEGFTVDARVHMFSIGAALDFYPFGSIFRVSPGVLFYNGNQVSASGGVSPGTSFSFEERNYYSAYPNPATGATPLTGTGVLGLHTHKPAWTITGGFGKVIPRSNRHWSFPADFGVAFIGAPTISVKMSGWACLDKAQTNCGSVTDATGPIGAEFNNDLNTRLARWRHELSGVTVYPIFSYGVMYSFNIR